MTRLAKPFETISNVNFSLQTSDREDYEKCEFTNCIFTDILNLNFHYKLINHFGVLKILVISDFF